MDKQGVLSKYHVAGPFLSSFIKKKTHSKLFTPNSKYISAVKKQKQYRYTLTLSQHPSQCLALYPDN